MPLINLDQGILKSIKNFIYGIFHHNIYRDTLKLASQYDDLMLLIVYGEMLGFPTFSNIFTLRLLPHIIPDIERWKARILRRDVI